MATSNYYDAQQGVVVEPAYVRPMLRDVVGTTLSAVGPDGSIAGVGFTTEAYQQVNFFVTPAGQYVRLMGPLVDEDGSVPGGPDGELLAITAPEIVPLRASSTGVGATGNGWVVAGTTTAPAAGPDVPALAIVSPSLRVTILRANPSGTTEVPVSLAGIRVPDTWGTAARLDAVNAAESGNVGATLTNLNEFHVLLGTTVDNNTDRLRRAVVVPTPDAIRVLDEAAVVAATPACPCKPCAPAELFGTVRSTPSVPSAAAACGGSGSCGTSCTPTPPVIASTVLGWEPYLESTAIATPAPTTLDLWELVDDTSADRALRTMAVGARGTTVQAQQSPLLVLGLSLAESALTGAGLDPPLLLTYDAVTGARTPVAGAELSVTNFVDGAVRDLRVEQGVVYAMGTLEGGAFTPAVWALDVNSLVPLTDVGAFGRIDASSALGESLSAQLTAGAVLALGSAVTIAVTMVDVATSPEFVDVITLHVPRRDYGTVSGAAKARRHPDALTPAFRSSAAVRAGWPVYADDGTVSIWGDIGFGSQSINAAATAPTFREAALTDDATRRVIRVPLQYVVGDGCRSVVVQERASRGIPLLRTEADARTVTVSTQDAGAHAVLAVEGVIRLSTGEGITNPLVGMLRVLPPSTLQIWDPTSGPTGNWVNV